MKEEEAAKAPPGGRITAGVHLQQTPENPPTGPSETELWWLFHGLCLPYNIFHTPPAAPGFLLVQGRVWFKSE